MVKVAPSFLGIKEYNKLRSFLQKIERYQADRVHVDFSDGVFIPEKSEPDLLWKMSLYTRLRQELHLMVEYPLEFLDLINRKITINRRDVWIVLHLEAKGYYECLIDFIKLSGFACGLAIKPETPFTDISIETLKKLDLITVMTVVPGTNGQTVSDEQSSKVSDLVKLRQQHGCHFEIEVENVNDRTVYSFVDAGADVLVPSKHIQENPSHIRWFHSLKV